MAGPLCQVLSSFVEKRPMHIRALNLCPGTDAQMLLQADAQIAQIFSVHLAIDGLQINSP